MSDPTAAPAQEKASLIEDFVDIWTSPSKVFERRKDAGFWGPLLILSVVIGALMFVARDTLFAIIDAQMMKNAQGANAAQMEQAKGMVHTFGLVGILVGVPIGVLILGIGVWITGKIMGAEEFGYTKATMIGAYSMTPKALGAVIFVVQAMVTDVSKVTNPGAVSLSAARFLGEDAPQWLMQLLLRVDPFVLWQTILIAIGVSVVGKVSREKLIPTALICYALGAIPALWAMLMALVRGS